MKKHSILIAFAFLFSLTSATNETNSLEEGWINLLDKNLSKWDMYLSYKHQNGYSGKVPTDVNGNEIPPIGYNKNVNNMFTVIQENKEPVLKVSGEYYGCVFTKEDFKNYRLKLKVKFGNKKWEPRTEKLKDAGVLYHSQGKAGVDYWRAWMLSQEFQIMEGHFGDYWNIANSAIDIKAYLPEGSMNAVADEDQPFIPFGTHTENTGFCMRKMKAETPNNGWTEIELVCFEGKSLHIVNGKVVMVLQNSRYFDGEKFMPLNEGKIQLQSEACQVYYKNIKIKPINKMPTEFENYFK
ncbi:3-keto-disaccharide hydrolase [Flavobacterium sp. RS13.1]|uniref:3-keto-disaccharide hydrolase n=1 Tax=Flavobacterium sp. RS13.1 TaxID=3400345 RepID=UPI003AB0E9D0